jgi:hypothetical protein
MPPGTMGPITGRVEQGPGHGYCPHLKEFWALRLHQKKNLGGSLKKCHRPVRIAVGLRGNSCASHVRLPGYAHCRPKLARFLGADEHLETEPCIEQREDRSRPSNLFA